ncbi:DUF6328 family protein [Microbacterium sp. NPDC006705]|jgi:hypothetical protein|uniref:DUF6328 family protein n=1 Tax=Microbacterium TaxID=33882 RepID=UPI000DCAFF8C|nr:MULTISPECIES: DUF6328 family protein [Microbacterium]MDF2916882.1 sodium:proton antiporter [Microbacterium sp.]RAZ34700.1 sodium:proton antiporter [Microbacterium sp. SMR1]WRK18637.1 DUF6328 family protein [Microbacterium plantarum]
MSPATPVADRGDDVADDGRAESADERADRNWNELLQELRVLQTGTQILTGFLLALAFQPAFRDLSGPQRVFYLTLVVLAALSAIVALSPVALHRGLFRRRAKPAVVAFGHTALLFALVTVSVLLVGVVVFVFDVVVSTAASWVAGGALAFLIALLWVVSPLIYRHRRSEDR